MDTIALEGMRFWAQHGFYEEEMLLGGWFTVDISVTTDFKKAAKVDELTDTLNYETVYLIARFQMSKPNKLLETVAYRIIAELQNKFDAIQSLRVRITKHNPPLGGNVAAAVITVEEDYKKQCAKCRKSLLCYNDDRKNCWCNTVRISPDIQRLLTQQFNGCLCRSCLLSYSH